MPFPRFPRLPSELRNIIWTLAILIHPRIVEVRWASMDGFTFHCCTPALLLACQESHAISRLFYQTSTTRISNGYVNAFDNSFRLRPTKNRLPSSQTYFNFEKDILYFPYRFRCAISYGHSLEAFLRKFKDSKKLRHLAIALPFAHDDERSYDFGSKIQELARRSQPLTLQTITLAFNDSYFERKSDVHTQRDSGIAHDFETIEPVGKERTASILLSTFKLSLSLEIEANTAGHSNNSWGDPEILMKTVNRRS